MTGEKDKRPYLKTDIECHLLHVKAHTANIHGSKRGCEVFDRTKEKFPTIKGFPADEGYRGGSIDHVEKEMGLKMEISKKIKDEWGSFS